MARIRTVKPEFWDDEKLARVSRDARLTFIGMWNHSDDYGVVKGHASWLKHQIYPYDELKVEQFQKWLDELQTIRVILPFQVNDEKFYYIPKFQEHQVVNKPSKQRNPLPPDDIMNATGILPEQDGSTTVQLPVGREVGNRNRKGRDIGSSKQHLRYIFLTEEEHGQMIIKIGQTLTDEYIERLDGYIGQIGVEKAKAKYKSHYDVMMNWYRKDLKEGKVGNNGNGSQPGKTYMAPIDEDNIWNEEMERMEKEGKL